MDGLRTTILLTLFAFGAGTILAGLASWLWLESPAFDPRSPGLGNAILPALYAALLFVMLYTLRIATAHLIRWAAARQHQRTLRFLQHLAPRLARSALGTALGASLTLSSAAVASAWATPVPGIQQPVATEAGPRTADENPAQRGASEQLPTPRWSAEVINVPMARIVGGTKRSPAPGRMSEAEVVVAEGQTLWSIASGALGSQATIAEISALWPRIYEMNRSVIGADPDLLQVGAVLRLPAVQ